MPWLAAASARSWASRPARPARRQAGATTMAISDTPSPAGSYWAIATPWWVAGGAAESGGGQPGRAAAPPGGRDYDGDFGHAVASRFVLGDRDPMVGGGVDGHQREPPHVVPFRQVRQQGGSDFRRAAKEPAAQGVGIGCVERFGQFR